MMIFVASKTSWTFACIYIYIFFPMDPMPHKLQSLRGYISTLFGRLNHAKSPVWVQKKWYSDASQPLVNSALWLVPYPMLIFLGNPHLDGTRSTFVRSKSWFWWQICHLLHPPCLLPLTLRPSLKLAMGLHEDVLQKDLGCTGCTAVHSGLLKHLADGIMECTIKDWLVVGPPLWKIWKSIGMMRNPIYGKIKLMATKPPTRG